MKSGKLLHGSIFRLKCAIGKALIAKRKYDVGHCHSILGRQFSS